MNKFMTKKDEVFLGDKVITKKGFKTVLPDKNMYEAKDEQFEGIVIEKRGDSFLVLDIGKEMPFTHYAGGLLQKRTGVAVEKKQINLVEESTEFANRDEEDFVKTMKELAFQKLMDNPRKIRSLEDSMKTVKRDIAQLAATLNEKEITIREKNFEINELKDSAPKTMPDYEHFQKQWKGLLKNRYIEHAGFVTLRGYKNLLITTRDLPYISPRFKDGETSFGAYKIAIPLEKESGDFVKVANYKKHIRGAKYHHPCVNEFNPCLGTEVGNHISKLIKEGNPIGVAHAMIAFLIEPNYNGPHIDDISFSCAQNVTIKPSDDSKWFDYSTWESQIWNAAQFDIDFSKASQS